MPVEACEIDGGPGFRYGDEGTCYGYVAGDEASRETARSKADAQGRAINARKESGMGEDMQDQPKGAPTYAMVALIPEPEVAKALVLDVEGAEPVEVLHVTLVYLGPDATTKVDRVAVEEAIRSVLGGFEPLSGVFNGSAVFGPDPEGQIPVVATLDVVGLSGLRDLIHTAIRAAVDLGFEDTHGFLPHATRAYVPSIPDAFPPPPMIETTFGSVYLCWGDYLADPANLTEFPLGEPPAEEMSEEPVGNLTLGDGRTLSIVVREGKLVLALAEPKTFQDGGDPEPPAPDPAVPAPSVEPEWEMLCVIEDVATDDGRFPTELTWREPPIALLYTDEDPPFGHEGAKRVGTVTEIERREGGEIWCRGVWLDTEDADEVRRLVDAGGDAAGWPSIRLTSPLTKDEVDPEGMPEDYEEEIVVVDEEHVAIKIRGKIVNVALVPTQAQAGTLIRNLTPAEPIAAAIPVRPPVRFFERPNLTAPTPPILVEEGPDAGHYYGHAGVWDGLDTCYRGRPGCLEFPRAFKTSDFSSFEVGHTMTAEGTLVRTGGVVLKGGHRPDEQIAAANADTRAAFADVRVGTDEFGLWFSGALRSDVTPEQVRVARASPISVEAMNGELVGMTCVNRPAFLVRALAAAATGKIRKLEIVGPSPTATEENSMDAQTFAEMHAAAHAAEGEQESFEVVGKTDLPVAPIDTVWDESAAAGRVAESCGGAGGLNPACYGQAFLWLVPDEDPANVDSYLFGFADVVEGVLSTVWAGVQAVGAAIADGPEEIPEEDLEPLRESVSALYAACAAAFDDPTLVPPWEVAAPEEAPIAAAVDERYLSALDAHVFGPALAALDARVGA